MHTSPSQSCTPTDAQDPFLTTLTFGYHILVLFSALSINFTPATSLISTVYTGSSRCPYFHRCWMNTQSLFRMNYPFPEIGSGETGKEEEWIMLESLLEGLLRSWIHIWLRMFCRLCPPKTTGRNSNPQCNSISTWEPLGGDQVVQAEPSWVGLALLRKRPRELPFPFGCVMTQREVSPLGAQQQALTTYQICHILILDFSTSKTVTYVFFCCCYLQAT